MQRTTRVHPLLLVALLAAVPARAQTPLAELTVHAGDHERVNVPVSASLEGVPLHLAEGTLQLVEVTGGRNTPVASQLDPGTPDRLAWMLSGTTPAGATRTFQLRSVPGAPAAALGSEAVHVADDGDYLRVTVDG